jgi:hypothetical protein
MRAIWTTYRGSHLVQRIRDAHPDFSPARFTEQGVSTTCKQTHEDDLAFGVEYQIDDWSTEAYVALPGAVYAGNRFPVSDTPYSCLLREPWQWTPDVENTISNIPRLEIGSGKSRVQLLSGDMAIPAMLVGLPDGTGLLLLAKGDRLLMEVEESEDRKTAWLRILTPGVREDLRYHAGPGFVPSQDRAMRFDPGDEVRLEYRAIRTDAGTPTALFAVLFEHRGYLQSAQVENQLPFSKAYELVADKYNRVNWDEEPGYYAVGDHTEVYDHWQMGWVGGGISAYALLADQDPKTHERIRRNLEWIVRHGQAPSGVYWSFARGEFVFGDMVDMDFGDDWHLVRRTGDAVYFLTKLHTAIDDENSRLKQSILTACDALSEIWRNHRQFGHFVSDRTRGKICVGNSTSGGIVPAGLALAARRFHREDLLAVAEESAEEMVHRFVRKGFTSGGPGEAVHCPDSESAFGLLESLVTLYDVTQDSKWLAFAQETAHLAASWVMNWDFPFPASSSMGRLAVRTTGSVWANAQNKHSAPAICTLSGVSLLRLARATGDWRYLELLRDIAHGVPQYLSREDRPVFGMSSGFMCERVNTCDWETPDIPIGEGFPIGCWCEVSTLLTYLEVPGIYIDTSSGRCTVVDHLEAELSTDERHWTLTIHNPTAFPARVSVLAESDAERRVPLPFLPLQNAAWLTIEPGGKQNLNVKRI